MPRIVDHDKRRADLLDAAFAIFDARGFAAVSVRELAQELGVSTGTIYHYFTGKEAMFEALVRRRFEADLAAATADIDEHTTAQQRLSMVSTWAVSNLAQLQGTLRLALDFARQQRDPPGWLADVLGGYQQPFEQALGPERASVALSVLLGLLTRELLAPNQADVSAHLMVLAGLLGTNSQGGV